MAKDEKILRATLVNGELKGVKVQGITNYKKEFSFNGEDRQPRQRPKRGKKKKHK